MKISSKEGLRQLYEWPQSRAGIKVLPCLEQHSIKFISHSPFLVMSTADGQGRMDTSPRGGKPGFVVVQDKSTILIPDARGNNRVDSLVNIVETGRVGLLFMIPGVNESLRINGSASIHINKVIIDAFVNERQPPISYIEVKVEEMFLHCAKAFMRSELWEASSVIERKVIPSMGKMLNDQLGTNKPLESQEEMERRYQKDL